MHAVAEYLQTTDAFSSIVAIRTTIMDIQLADSVAAISNKL